MRYEFTGKVWLYSGPAAWHFVSLPTDLTEGLKALRGRTSGWGTMRVRVTTGKTSWDTSIFPDSKSGSFLLPLKADVRRREGIVAGEARDFAVELLI